MNPPAGFEQQAKENAEQKLQNNTAKNMDPSLPLEGVTVVRRLECEDLHAYQLP